MIFKEGTRVLADILEKDLDLNLSLTISSNLKLNCFIKRFQSLIFKLQALLMAIYIPKNPYTQLAKYNQVM